MKTFNEDFIKTCDQINSTYMYMTTSCLLMTLIMTCYSLINLPCYKMYVIFII